MTDRLVLWTEKANRWFMDLFAGPRESVVDAICETASMPDDDALRQAKLKRLLHILRQKDWETTPEGRAYVEAIHRKAAEISGRIAREERADRQTTLDL